MENNTLEEMNERLAMHLERTDWDGLEATEVLRWADETFSFRAVLATSFQNTGMAMLHMAAECGLTVRLATFDTLRLHAETYAFMEQVKERYGCEIEVWQPSPAQLQRMIDRFGEYLFFDSKEKQEHCCDVRKTKPRNALLKTVDCWISGQRWDQSVHRKDTAKKAELIGEYGTQRKILKLNPLVDWSEERLSAFVRDNDVPTHPLYDQGYPSFGCTICATPIRPGEDKRAGRWRWFNQMEDVDDKKECGLHYNI
jgi:phosphoadenosine phosphosulfate reductase